MARRLWQDECDEWREDVASGYQDEVGYAVLALFDEYQPEFPPTMTERLMKLLDGVLYAHDSEMLRLEMKLSKSKGQDG